MATEECPPQPRKLPQQERSRRMVAAIIDACKKILVEHGEDALSLPLLETVSGVTKGSIYQYFPNLPAIVAALYERECRLSIEQGLIDNKLSVGQQTLMELLDEIVDKSIQSQKQLQSLHSSFYSRYNLYYHLGEKFDQHDDTLAWSKSILAPLIEKHVGDETLENPVRTAFIAMETLKSQFWAVLRFDPDHIHTGAFRRQLIASVLCIVDNAPRKN